MPARRVIWNGGMTGSSLQVAHPARTVFSYIAAGIVRFLTGSHQACTPRYYYDGW